MVGADAEGIVNAGRVEPRSLGMRLGGWFRGERGDGESAVERNRDGDSLTELGDGLEGEGGQSGGRLGRANELGGAFSLLLEVLEIRGSGRMGFVLMPEGLCVPFDLMVNVFGGNVGYTLVLFLISDLCSCEMTLDGLGVDGATTSFSHVSISSVLFSVSSGKDITSGTPWLEWQSEKKLEPENRAFC